MTAYLAIDTATDVASVALGTPDQVAAELVLAGRRHGTALAPAIQDVLRLAELKVGDVTGIILADGPGSFTGLRIGVATAKGLIQAHDHLTLATAPSLLALAWIARPFATGPVAALYDALRGELFAAVYRFEGNGVETLVEPSLTTPERLSQECPVAPDVAVGDGAGVHAEWVTEWTGRAPVGPPLVVPRAGSLLQLHHIPGAVRAIDDVDRFEPAYGRLAEAQVRWEDTHGQPLPGSRGTGQ